MYNEIYEKVKEYDNIVIARHVGVDPDALCSQLAMRDSIKLTFPDKHVIAVGVGSARFAHIGRLDKLEKLDNALLIVTDTPDKKRIDSANPDDFDYVIKIDHHPFVEKFGDLEFIEDDKSSACEIVMKILDETKLQCNRYIAEYLYMGLVSDSNRFLFDNCTSNTFNLVSRYLEKYQFNLTSLYNKIYLRPLSEVRLEGYIASNMVVTPNRLGYIIIDDSKIKEFGVDSASAANLINNFNHIREVLVWCTISEDVKNNQYRISIRSRGPVINKVAEKHNGGGHAMASGARPKTLDDAMALMNDLDNLLKEFNEKEEVL